MRQAGLTGVGVVQWRVQSTEFTTHHRRWSAGDLLEAGVDCDCLTVRARPGPLQLARNIPTMQSHQVTSPRPPPPLSKYLTNYPI